MHTTPKRPSRTNKPDPNKSNMITCALGNNWSAPNTLPISIIIKRAIYHHPRTLFAIDTCGKLVLGDDSTVEYFKDTELIQIDEFNTGTVLFVARNKIWHFSGDNKPIQTFHAENDTIQRLYCGGQHCFIKTRKGYFAVGSNVHLLSYY